ncbi:MAG: glycosyltransferase family 4 protein [Chloroflexota bacterium]|nr:glycosyltransferase family 4 protein [Chloroflexota bacterium]
MRVTLISFTFFEYNIHLANGLAEHAEIQLILPAEGEAYCTALDSRVQVHILRHARIRQPAAQTRNMMQVYQVVRAFKPDLVHVQQGYFWLTFLIPLLERYPLVITIHDPMPHLGDHESRKTPTQMFHYGFWRADQLIVHGKSLRETVVNELNLDAQRVHVVPHIKLGEDIGDPDATHEMYPDTRRVLFFGRIWEYKGLEYLIRAEPLVSEKVPDVKIVIAGRGEDFGKYRAMMQHPERFEVHNEFISEKLVRPLFEQASVVALPYVEATQSGVIPLAYAYARPVVTTHVGALPDVVDNYRTGILVPPRDVEALADTLVRLLRNPRLAYQMGVAGKRKLDREANPGIVAAQTMQVYERALGAASGE